MVNCCFQASPLCENGEKIYFLSILIAGIYSYRGSATDLALHSLKDRIMDSFRWKIHHPSQLRKEDMIKTIQEGAVDLIPARSSTDSPRDLPRILGYVKAKIQAELIL